MCVWAELAFGLTFFDVTDSLIHSLNYSVTQLFSQLLSQSVNHSVTHLIRSHHASVIAKGFSHDVKRLPKTVPGGSRFRETFSNGFEHAFQLLCINVQCRQALCRSFIQLNMTQIATRNVPLKQF